MIVLEVDLGVIPVATKGQVNNESDESGVSPLNDPIWDHGGVC